MPSFALSQLCGRLNNPTMTWESHLTGHLSPIISPFANRGLSRRLTWSASGDERGLVQSVSKSSSALGEIPLAPQ
jgi:hypothetical protein